ncbi:MAG TPA: flagellar basal body rod protein FlgB [Burkholderiaceae bacterium]|jgi:flagellar basal-body rod protein FlgB|nr:flagellar basal body rod protein FlgB [Burkholderiaceae bacterium]
MSGKLDDYLRLNETAINLRAQRQQLLASNIANADTPNYKARDIDFSKSLQTALTRSEPPATPLTKTNPAHLDPPSNVDGTSGSEGEAILYRSPIQPSADGNTVDMDVERNAFADNAVHYEAGLTLITAQIKDMLAVIQG